MSSIPRPGILRAPFSTPEPRALAPLAVALALAACGGAEVKPLPGGPPPEYESPRPFDAGAAGKPATAGPDEGPNSVPAPVPTDAPGGAPSPTP